MSNEGKKVKVHYTGTLGDGSKFDSSLDRGEPLAFTCMAGQMIPGFDAAVRDMSVGDKVTVRLEPAEAYGERDESLVQEVPAEVLGPQGASLKVGDKVMLRSQQGYPMPATVARRTLKTVTFDLNHELAGQALTFEIELLEAV